MGVGASNLNTAPYVVSLGKSTSPKERNARRRKMAEEIYPDIPERTDIWEHIPFIDWGE